VLGNDAFEAERYANPFRQWTTQDQLAQISPRPLLYPPGTNWNYAHTNYVLLGLALEKATGQNMPTLLADRVFGFPQDPQRHTVLRRVHVLESVLDHHPWSDPDHQHLRPRGHGGGHRLGQAAVPRLVQEDGVDGQNPLFPATPP